MRIYKPETTRPIPTTGAKVDTEKGTVSYKGRGGWPVKAVLTANGKMRVPQSTWHIGFRDALDREQDIAAFDQENPTRLLAGRIQTLINLCGEPMPTDLREYTDRLPQRIIDDLEASGLLPRQQKEIALPLLDLVDMYEQFLNTRDRNGDYIEDSCKMIREVFAACGFTLWRNIRADTVASYLKARRDGRTEGYDELLKAADMKVKEQKDQDGKPIGIGYVRSNGYVTAIATFCNWIVDEKQWATSSPMPKKGMKLNTKSDLRHPRRAITVEEVRLLLRKTADGPERYGMSGQERYLLYRTAIETGLRRAELQRLVTSDFNLDGHTLTVRGVKATKNKTTTVQALSPGLCAELRPFLGTKLPGVKAFGGSYEALTDRTADMIRQDLEAAGLPYKDGMGACFDFHALRGECASMLVDSGVNPKQTQEIMRHSNISLTMDVYAKVLGNDKKALAIASLPDLSLPQAQVLAKTGTDDQPELYGEVYGKVTSDRPTSHNTGQANLDITPQTAILAQNQRPAYTASLVLRSPSVDGF